MVGCACACGCLWRMAAFPRASHPEGHTDCYFRWRGLQRGTACLQPYEWNVKLVWADGSPGRLNCAGGGRGARREVGTFGSACRAFGHSLATTVAGRLGTSAGAGGRQMASEQGERNGGVRRRTSAYARGRSHNPSVAGSSPARPTDLPAVSQSEVEPLGPLIGTRRHRAATHDRSLPIAASMLAGRHAVRAGSNTTMSPSSTTVSGSTRSTRRPLAMRGSASSTV
jgi:hypothetical protein